MSGFLTTARDPIRRRGDCTRDLGRLSRENLSGAISWFTFLRAALATENQSCRLRAAVCRSDNLLSAKAKQRSLLSPVSRQSGRMLDLIHGCCRVLVAPMRRLSQWKNLVALYLARTGKKQADVASRAAAGHCPINTAGVSDEGFRGHEVPCRQGCGDADRNDAVALSDGGAGGTCEASTTVSGASRNRSRRRRSKAVQS